MVCEQSEIEWFVERSKIIETIVGFANALDEKDWRKFREYLTNEIDIDYSEFRGEPPQRVNADVYVQQRVEGLTGLRTLHISTNHQVTIAKDLAQCKSAYCIYRVDPSLEAGQNRLDTAGHYLHQLIRVEGTWRIQAVKQTVTVISGNPKIHGALRFSQQNY